MLRKRNVHQLLLSRILVLEESSPSLTRRCHTTHNNSNNNNNAQSAVAAKDEEMYGGLKSLDILTSETHGIQKTTSSWKWHLWQLVAAMMPALGIYTLGQYISHNTTREAPVAVPASGLEYLELKDRLARVEEQLDVLMLKQQEHEQEQQSSPSPPCGSMNNREKKKK